MRIAAGLSQEQIGEASGSALQQIQKYEKGTNRMSAGRLCTLAQALGRRPGEFFDGITNRTDAGESVDRRVADFMMTTEAIRLCTSVVALDPKQRKAVYNFVRWPDRRLSSAS